MSAAKTPRGGFLTDVLRAGLTRAAEAAADRIAPEVEAQLRDVAGGARRVLDSLLETLERLPPEHRALLLTLALQRWCDACGTRLAPTAGAELPGGGRMVGRPTCPICRHRRR